MEKEFVQKGYAKQLENRKALTPLIKKLSNFKELIEAQKFVVKSNSYSGLQNELEKRYLDHLISCR